MFELSIKEDGRCGRHLERTRYDMITQYLHMGMVLKSAVYLDGIIDRGISGPKFLSITQRQILEF